MRIAYRYVCWDSFFLYSRWSQVIPSSSAFSLLLSLKIMSRDRAPRVFLGRLPRDIKEKDVERFFRGFGRIREINLKNGFGFVVSYIYPYRLCGNVFVLRIQCQRSVFK